MKDLRGVWFGDSVRLTLGDIFASALKSFISEFWHFSQQHHLITCNSLGDVNFQSNSGRTRVTSELQTTKGLKGNDLSIIWCRYSPVYVEYFSKKRFLFSPQTSCLLSSTNQPSRHPLFPIIASTTKVFMTSRGLSGSVSSCLACISATVTRMAYPFHFYWMGEGFPLPLGSMGERSHASIKELFMLTEETC